MGAEPRPRGAQPSRGAGLGPAGPPALGVGLSSLVALASSLRRVPLGPPVEPGPCGCSADSVSVLALQRSPSRRAPADAAAPSPDRPLLKDPEPRPRRE